jgi:hypothetical protein
MTANYLVELVDDEHVEALGRATSPEAAAAWRTTQAAARHLPIEAIRIRPVEVASPPPAWVLRSGEAA